jgi:hypothetical protein
MASTRVVTGVIANNTSQTFVLGTQTLEWGDWSTNPPASINPNSSGTFVAKGTSGTATGTQGTVTYTTGDGATLTFNFNDPYEPGNAFSSSSSSPNYSVSNNSPSGNAVTVNYTVNAS